VNNTGKIGLFRILSESSVAAGVRRIEAVTGTGVLSLLRDREALIAEAAHTMKVQNPADLAKKAQQLQSDLSAARKELEAMEAKMASSKLDDILRGAVDVKGCRLICGRLDGMKPDAARNLADDVKANDPTAVLVLALVSDGKLNFMAAAGKDAVSKGAHCGKLVGAVAAVTGGKGGGRPDNAMAGGQDAEKVADALAAAADLLAAQIK
jgi:alanyl-tRNA synthetase